MTVRSVSNDRKPIAVFASDSPYYPTGFAKQCSHIAGFAAEEMGWDVHYLAWQTRGNPKVEGYPFEIHGVLGRAPFGKDSYMPLFEKVGPDILFTQGDGHMVDQLTSMPRPFWLWYFPIDGHPINRIIGNVLQRVDVRIAMSKYGRELVKRQMGLDSEYVPHGVDTKMYVPINKIESRKAFFEMYGLKPQKCDVEDAFIVGCVARMNLRKHHIRLLAAFSKFLNTGKSQQEIEEKKKKCYLYLHLDPKDPLFVPDPNHDYLFYEWIDVFGLNENVIITPERRADGKRYDFINGIPEQDLVLLYNSFNVHALTTGGEGFGIPTVEAMSCGVPTIITDYTTSRELISVDEEGKELPLELARGIAVPPSRLYLENCGVHKAWVNIDAFALAIETYYQKPELRDKQSEEARKFAEKNYDWKVVENMWKNVFEKVNNKVELVM